MYAGQFEPIIDTLREISRTLTEIRDRLPAPPVEAWRELPEKCPVHGAALEPGYWFPPKHRFSCTSCSDVSTWPPPPAAAPGRAPPRGRCVVIDPTEFRTGASRDGEQTFECMACWQEVDAQNWTLAQLTEWAMDHACPRPRDEPPESSFMEPIELTELDRNARAYGWEIGRGAVLGRQVESSPGNPFLDAAWRERLPLSEAEIAEHDAAAEQGNAL